MYTETNYSQLNNRTGRLPYGVETDMGPIGILKRILDRLDERGVSYAIIHGFKDLPDIRSDVDIAFADDPKKVIQPVLEELAGNGCIRIVQCLHYEIPLGYYYILLVTGTYPPEYLHLDCLYDPYGINAFYIPTPELLRGRVRESWGYRSADEKSALYLLVKKSIKGVMTSDARNILRKWLAASPISSEVTDLFGTGGEGNIRALLKANDPVRELRHLKLLRRSLAKNFIFRHPIRYARRLLTSWRRLLFRATHPTGFFVVFLGPDGCGKSTLARGTESNLARAYRKQWRFHWRPGLLPKLSRNHSNPADNAAPPKHTRYGFFLSLARYLYYLADFILGYWAVVYPKRIRTTLVLGERWYYDVMVNPERYGFALPHWLLFLGSKLIPAPDAVILFTADPSIISRRKPELNIEEIRDQIEKFRCLFRDAPLKEIETGKDVFFSLRELTDHITLRTADRTSRMFNLNSPAQWKAFPSRNNVKVWINRKDTFKNALHLYQPYSLLGRHSKRIAGALPERVQKIITRHSNLPAIKRDELLFYTEVICEVLSDPHLTISYSRGTPGPHQKITAQASREKPFCYVKIGRGTSIGNLLHNERNALREIQFRESKVFEAPRVLADITRDNIHFLFLSAPDTDLQAGRPLMPDTRDIRFLEGELPADPLSIPLQKALPAFDASEIEPALLDESMRFIDWCGIRQNVMAGPAHGDYAPWNTLGLRDTLYVYDWEYCTKTAPLLTDLFHRILMPAHLVLRMDARRIIDRLIGVSHDMFFKTLIAQSRILPGTLPAYLLLYLLRQHRRAMDTNKGFAQFLESCIRDLLRRRQ